MLRVNTNLSLIRDAKSLPYLITYEFRHLGKTTRVEQYLLSQRSLPPEVWGGLVLAYTRENIDLRPFSHFWLLVYLAQFSNRFVYLIFAQGHGNSVTFFGESF